MGSNTKLLLVAFCGVVLAASVLGVSDAAAKPTAYRGGSVGSLAPLQQQASSAAGQASAAFMEPLKAGAAAYRDSK